MHDRTFQDNLVDNKNPDKFGVFACGAGCRTRTGMSFDTRGILSPLRLPFRQAGLFYEETRGHASGLVCLPIFEASGAPIE